ncbi:resolvase [Sporanaerobium hydrogeniformans]|uniref:Resolvase n=1 Tax=Sporanaerobium hydrogeniformans TaxID=3072179 RepID=A0AC61DEQ0_9FIRM|nr:recombinase family protein [Sporanaerobium hydrogeniformans]PHV71685.1 resolvase [Sporanaerobium hydrogeniformans]
MLYVGIYSRKSKFTGKGESIENQIEMGTSYAKSHFHDQDIKIVVYEDEGFTGANTDRPEFKRLMKDVANKKLNVLICYRLDRISRNVADFSSTLTTLENNNVAFISIREQFDTSTPMGRAMMYIASVFAQLERETIAERIRDNMIQLARTGRWLGGVTPLGFRSEQVITTDESGKTRKQHRLVVEPEEIKKVKLFFDKFLELGSVIKLESYLIDHAIKTKKEKYFDLTSLKFILTNPTYLTADSTSYEYFKNKGCEIYRHLSEFDGTKGIMVYNRTNQSKHTTIKNDITSWVIAIGEHPAILPSKDWIAVQIKMEQNSDKSFRKVHNQEALLPGVLRCGNCGSYMRPKSSRMSADGSTHHYYYICELKEKSHGKKCNINNITGHKLDSILMKELKKLSQSSSTLADKINLDNLRNTTEPSDLNKEIEKLKKHIADNEILIDNLLTTLGATKNSPASNYILNKVNLLGNEISTLYAQINKLEEQRIKTTMNTFNLDLMSSTLKHFADNVDHATTYQKREMIKQMIDKATWDGENLLLDIWGDASLGEL